MAVGLEDRTDADASQDGRRSGRPSQASVDQQFDEMTRQTGMAALDGHARPMANSGYDDGASASQDSSSGAPSQSVSTAANAPYGNQPGIYDDERRTLANRYAPDAASRPRTDGPGASTATSNSGAGQDQNWYRKGNDKSGGSTNSLTGATGTNTTTQKPDTDIALPKTGSRKAKGQVKGVRSWLKRFKWVGIGGGVIATIAALVLSLVLTLVSGSLKLIDLATHTAFRGSAQTARENRVITNNLVVESAEEAAADSTTQEQASTKVSGLKDKILGRFFNSAPVKGVTNLNNNYNFSKVANNLQNNVTLVRDDSAHTLVKPVKAIIINGERIELPKAYINTFGGSSYFKGFDSATINKLTRASSSALLENHPNMPTVVRSIAMVKFLVANGVNVFTAIRAGLFNNTKPQDAKVIIEEESSKIVDGDTSKAISTLSTDEEKAAASKAVQDQKDVLSNIAEAEGPNGLSNLGLDSAPSDSGLSAKAAGSLTSKLGAGSLVEAGGAINPLISVGVPVCEVADGFKYDPIRGTELMKSKMNSATLVQSLAGAQRAGSKGTSNGWNTAESGAVNWKLGSIEDSVPIMRDNKLNTGVINTLATAGAGGSETSFLGNYDVHQNVFDAVLPSGFPAKSLIASALGGSSGFCSVVMSDAFNGVILTASGVALILPEGDIISGATAATARELINKAFSDIATRIINQFTTRQGANQLGQMAKQLALKGIENDAVNTAASKIGRVIAGRAAGLVVGGAATGAIFDNMQDEGWQLVNSGYRQGNGGVAQTTAEANENQVDDQNYIADYNRSQSFATRYFALDNAYSLFSRLASSLQASTTHDFFAKAISNLAQLLRPLSLVSSLFGSLNGSAVAATNSKVDYNHYGDLTFGFTHDELVKIQTTPSYRSSISNDTILEDSGKQDQIVSDYGKCFTEPASQLLADGDIVRDSNTGDVITDQGTCSPQNLGFNNSHGLGDLVFRYRLSLAYDSGMAIQLGIQDAGTVGG